MGRMDFGRSRAWLRSRLRVKRQVTRQFRVLHPIVGGIRPAAGRAGATGVDAAVAGGNTRLQRDPLPGHEPA